MSKLVLAALTVLGVAGCAANPQLDPRPGGNPLGVDLSGQWELRTGAIPRASEEQTIRIPRTVNRTAQQGERPRIRGSRKKGASLYVFLEHGRSLKVTQTEFGLFFSFDRAIVEEYNFGEKRIVNVGPIEAQRVSGWDGDRFVAETMDEDGYVLTESWRLDADGTRLVRDISIAREDKTVHETQQVFERE
jgi:hypothetical protein